MLKPRPAEEGGKEEEGEEEEGGPEDVGPLGGQAVEPRAHDGPEHPPQGLGGTVEPRHQALLPLAHGQGEGRRDPGEGEPLPHPWRARPRARAQKVLA